MCVYVCMYVCMYFRETKVLKSGASVCMCEAILTSMQMPDHGECVWQIYPFRYCKEYIFADCMFSHVGCCLYLYVAKHLWLFELVKVKAV